MVSIIISFLFMFGLFFFGIKAVREATKKQRWTLTKYFVYSMICSVLALGALTVFVLLF